MAVSRENVPPLMVDVVEEYRGWTPSLPAQEIVRGLLEATPRRFLGGLSQVQLTTTGRPVAEPAARRLVGVVRKGRVVDLSASTRGEAEVERHASRSSWIRSSGQVDRSRGSCSATVHALHC